MKKFGVESAWDGKAMKHTPEQIVNMPRQIEVAVANGKRRRRTSREAGITEQTYRPGCPPILPWAAW
jgi:hypothetical protein